MNLYYNHYVLELLRYELRTEININALKIVRHPLVYQVFNYL
jgi:hypothetical protein